jgi:hypothetical protein
LSREGIRETLHFDNPPIAVNDVVHRVVEDCACLGVPVPLTLIVGGNLPLVEGDLYQLSCVLYSLVALLHRELDHAEDGVEIRTWQEDRSVRLSVSIKRPARLRAAFSGDLEQCATIIADHGGQMFGWLTSSHSIFVLELPAVRRP